METKFLIPERCFLMVIDPQERLMAAIHQAERISKNTALLAHLAQTFTLPVIPTTQYVKGLGPYIEDLRPLFERYTTYDKVEFSALKNRAIYETVKALQPRHNTLILCGVETHICVYQTALSALQQGLRVVIAADATSSRTPENMQYGLHRLRDIGAEIFSTEMIIYELLEKAGTPTFKALLPYLK